MRRFIIDHIDPSAETVHIGGSQAKHIARVLRMEVGDHLVIADMKGSRYKGTIVAVNPVEVVVRLIEPIAAPQPAPVQITLCQAVLKAKAMDLVVQKLTELGVSCLVPFYSQRTVVRFDAKREPSKLRHWREIARHATAQSDRDRPPEILPVSGFEEVLQTHADPSTLKIILWEHERVQDLKAILRQQSPGKRVIGITGPEGGFSKEEISCATQAGFIPVSLGGRILRAETAALVLVAICMYEWGDLGLSHMHK